MHLEESHKTPIVWRDDRNFIVHVVPITTPGIVETNLNILSKDYNFLKIYNI